MTSAVDTNILFDLLRPGSPFLRSSRSAVQRASQEGVLVISEPVYAELASFFSTSGGLDEFLDDVGVTLLRSTRAILHTAGVAWRQYSTRRLEGLNCRSCGRTGPVPCPACGAQLQGRQHLVADFLIGAHASALAGRLLTRDKGYYKTYFPQLELA